jgi:hypothetical protein
MPLVKSRRPPWNTSLRSLVYNLDMDASLKFQTLGSVLVIGTVVSSEAAAHLLAAYPSSAVAWYFNLEIFPGFEHARNLGFSPLFGPATLWIALLGLAVTILSGALRLKLAVGVIANLSFIFSLSFACIFYLHASTYKEASLVQMSLTSESDFYLLGIITAVSFTAFVACHATFLRSIFVERS